MNYYNEIKSKLINDETYSKVKNYSKERHKVITYFEIGKLLNEAGGKYGDNIIDEYSRKLVIEVGKKYNRRTLFRMKQFYNIFIDEKVSQLATQLSWSHYVELLPLKNIDEIKYYINICKEQNIGRDSLREKIRNNEYSRLPVETKNKLMLDDKIEVIAGNIPIKQQTDALNWVKLNIDKLRKQWNSYHFDHQISMIASALNFND